MPAPIQRNMFLDPRSLTFLAVAFLTGIAGALQMPTLSLFLDTEVGVNSTRVGIFYAAAAIIGIVVSQLLAYRSDRRGDRKILIIQCCVLGALGCLLFAYNRNYFILLLIGVTLSSFGSTANPQAFALAREHADKTGRESTMFTTIMRAQISLAWVIGPPIAFALVTGFGFTSMYMFAAGAYVICGILVWFSLPSMIKVRDKTPQKIVLPKRNRNAVILLFIACSLMLGANGVYLINMPLYLIHELNMAESWAGILMGTVAGLEIPVMLMAGLFARRHGKGFLMILSGITGVLFYIGLLFFSDLWQMLALQIFNAIYIGILATIGMIYFQDLMPNQAGNATTLYSNTGRIGWILAGSTGVIIEHTNHYTGFYLSLAMAFIAAVCLMSLEMIKKSNDKRDNALADQVTSPE